MKKFELQMNRDEKRTINFGKGVLREIDEVKKVAEGAVPIFRYFQFHDRWGTESDGHCVPTDILRPEHVKWVGRYTLRDVYTHHISPIYDDLDQIETRQSRAVRSYMTAAGGREQNTSGIILQTAGICIPLDQEAHDQLWWNAATDLSRTQQNEAQIGEI